MIGIRVNAALLLSWLIYPYLQTLGPAVVHVPVLKDAGAIFCFIACIPLSTCLLNSVHSVIQHGISNIAIDIARYMGSRNFSDLVITNFFLDDPRSA
jgi:hypothetical protein